MHVHSCRAAAPVSAYSRVTWTASWRGRPAPDRSRGDTTSWAQSCLDSGAAQVGSLPAEHLGAPLGRDLAFARLPEPPALAGSGVPDPLLIGWASLPAGVEGTIEPLHRSCQNGGPSP